MSNSNRAVGNKRSSMGNNWGMSNSNRSMGNNGWGMSNSSMSIGGNTFIGDFSNISTDSISSVVVDMLDSAIRKSYSVGSSGGVSISLFLRAKVGSTVVISNSVLVGIHSRTIIDGFRSIPRVGRQGSTHKGGEKDGGLHVAC